MSTYISICPCGTPVSITYSQAGSRYVCGASHASVAGIRLTDAMVAAGAVALHAEQCGCPHWAPDQLRERPDYLGRVRRILTAALAAAEPRPGVGGSPGPA